MRPNQYDPTVRDMRYDVYLSKDGAERRIELDLDVQFKPTDEFRYGPDIYVVASVQPGQDEFDAIIFADVAADTGGDPSS
jgi:hypothetical protein